MNMPRWLLIPFATALVLLAISCGGDDKDENASTGGAGASSSRELDLAGAAQALEDVKSFRFNVKLKMDFGDLATGSSGSNEDDQFAALFLALFNNIELTGAYVGPDSYEFKTRFFGQNIHMIQIGDQAWLNDGSGWTETDPDDSMFGGSPTDLAFDLLPNQVLRNATIKSEKVNGQNTTRYSFNKDQLISLLEDLGEDTFEVEEVDSLNLDVWLTKDNIPVKMVVDVKGQSEGSDISLHFEMNVTDLNDSNIKIRKPI